MSSNILTSLLFHWDIHSSGMSGGVRISYSCFDTAYKSHLQGQSSTSTVFPWRWGHLHRDKSFKYRILVHCLPGRTEEQPQSWLPASEPRNEPGTSKYGVLIGRSQDSVNEMGIQSWIASTRKEVVVFWCKYSHRVCLEGMRNFRQTLYSTKSKQPRFQPATFKTSFLLVVGVNIIILSQDRDNDS